MSVRHCLRACGFRDPTSALVKVMYCFDWITNTLSILTNALAASEPLWAMSYEFNSIPPGEKAKRWQRIHNAQAILSAADFPGHVLSVFYGKIALWEIWDLIEGKNKLM